MSDNSVGRNADNPWHDEELLRELYIEQGLSTHEVGDYFNTNGSVILRWLNKFDIPTRGTADHLKRDRPDDSTLHKLYVEQELSTRDIGDIYDCSGHTVSRWLKDVDIEARDNAHAIIGEGPENGNWKGGHDYWYGSGWKEQRQRALERDGFECRACGMSQEEHKQTLGRELEVHHVVPVRKFDDPRDANSLGNLVTACKECHAKFEGLPVFPPKQSP